MNQSPHDVRGPAMEIPHVQLLRSEIAARLVGAQVPTQESATRRRLLDLELEQLTYSLGAAYQAVMHLEELVRATALRVSARGCPPGGAIFGSPPSESSRLGWAVDSFLDACRRAQNAMIPFVSRTFRVSLPSSLRDLIEKPPKNASKVPGPVHDILRNYWGAGGRTLKDYRDMAQHYAVVSSDVYTQLLPDGTIQIHMLLPNNPQERSFAKISYGPPFVSASAYCRQAFLSLFAASYRLTFLLLRYMGHNGSVTVGLMRHETQFGGGAFSALPDDSFDGLIRDSRSALAAELKERFGGPLDPPIAPEMAIP